ncbi:hypothetical protein SBRCBS47491_010189 [Sporothrix bragantina]|uniref:Hypervirulence associated protein TUDOR domain-containing protein n=1 Tax=Sporothrix bragantina TaxID=671064 RepID=A0ABP0D0F0_9PEZI
MSDKVQPWKAAWPATTANANASPDTAVEYGVARGDIAVVDGTAANVKPAAPLRLEQAAVKTQPWKASWPGAEAAAAGLNTKSSAGTVAEYGVPKGDIAVVDGTAANVKPSTQKTVRVVRA